MRSNNYSTGTSLTLLITKIFLAQHFYGIVCHSTEVTTELTTKLTVVTEQGIPRQTLASSGGDSPAAAVSISGAAAAIADNTTTTADNNTEPPTSTVQYTTLPESTEWTSTEAAAERRNINVKSTSVPLPTYMVDIDPDQALQDIAVDESRSDLGSVYLHFESRKFKKVGQGKQDDKVKLRGNIQQYQEIGQQQQQQQQQQESQITNQLHQTVRPIQITSYVADSETAIPMNLDHTQANEIMNKTSTYGNTVNDNRHGADMISAFFVAPEDEVNEIEKPPFSGRPIVVTDLREDLVKGERYNGKDVTKPLTNDILAPIRAAITLSQQKEGPTVEKQVLREMPVYKTYIEIQKAIPYELKEEDQKEPRPVISNELVQQPQQVIYHRQPQQQLATSTPTTIRTPLVYRYPMYYYVPHSYIGNYLMRHSHENAARTNSYQTTNRRPIQYLLKYQPPQLYAAIVGHPAAYYLASPAAAAAVTTADEAAAADLNILQSESRPSLHVPPFRPSHPVFTSQYPPYTYRVMMQANGARGLAAHHHSTRAARSKQLCIEYGGFKPPMVPSVQIEEALAAEQAAAVQQTLIPLEENQEK